MLHFFINGQHLTTAEAFIVDGTIDYLQAQFCFSSADWQTMTHKWAHFACGDNAYDIELLSNRIEKDDHLNLTEGEWLVWLHGTRNESGEVVERITTNQVRLMVSATGSTETGSPFPSVPADAVEQLRADMGNLSDLQTEDKQSLVGAINEVMQNSNDISPEAIATAVEAYLIENPVKVITEHNELKNRDAYEQHPISAITGLEKVLGDKQPKGEYLTAESLQPAVNTALAQAKASGEFDGADGQPGRPGADGKQGADGYTPIKGTDYFTDEDKSEMVNAVLSALPDETDPTVPGWAKQPEPPVYTAADVGALPEDTAIPTKTSDLTNDSGFITNAVTDLVNYYRKSETYTQEEVNTLVSAIPKFSIEVVSTLPTGSISETTVYLLLTGSSNNLYTEYIYVKGNWELLGSQQVDLTGYATQKWVLEKIGEIVIPTKLSELADDTAHRTVTDAEKEAWNGKSNFSGDYNDLSNKPTIPTVPSMVSAFQNDAGYLAIIKNTFANGATVNVPNGNSEWTASGEVSTLTITYPANPYETWLKFTTVSSGTVTITLPISKYIGEAPVFGQGETWELSIKNGVVIAAKCDE